MKHLYNLYYYFLFKIKDPEKVTNHPRYNLQIKYAFRVGNKYYYRLSHDYDIPQNRFRYLKTYWQEVENKLTSNDINEFGSATEKYLEDYKKSLHKGEPIPELLDKAILLQGELKYRSKWLFEPTSLFKYASVLYFDLSEPIKDYDMEYNQSKIVLWSKKKELLRTFLQELMGNAESLLNLSTQDLKTYLSELQKMKDKQQQLISNSGHSKSKSEIEATILG